MVAVWVAKQKGSHSQGEFVQRHQSKGQKNLPGAALGGRLMPLKPPLPCQLRNKVTTTPLEQNPPGKYQKLNPFSNSVVKIN